jgi:hypothetical protein
MVVTDETVGTVSFTKSPPLLVYRYPLTHNSTTIHAIKNAIKIWRRSHVEKICCVKRGTVREKERSVRVSRQERVHGP